MKIKVGNIEMKNYRRRGGKMDSGKENKSEEREKKKESKLWR